MKPDTTDPIADLLSLNSSPLLRLDSLSGLTPMRK
jgi:hypothetical protein